MAPFITQKHAFYDAKEGILEGKRAHIRKKNDIKILIQYIYYRIKRHKMLYE